MTYFEYFDSFRGILCISVILFHDGLSLQTLDGFNFGVMGFFILSSFLLTYRLLKQYENVGMKLKMIVQITINYIITRLFRIYLPFLVYCYINKYYIGDKEITKKNDTMYSMATLTYWPRSTHLWTMPIELRFYVLIPFIAFLFSKLVNNRNIVLTLFLVNIIVLASIKKYNLIQIGEDNEIATLDRYLPVFCAGSTLALLYANIEKTNLIKTINNNKMFHYILTIPTGYIFACLMREHAWVQTNVEDAYYYAIRIVMFMLLLLISPLNLIAQYLASERLLKLFGKFSYGAYLFHISVLRYKNKYPSKLIRIKTDECIAYLSVSLICGIMFYYFIENNLIIISKYFINKIDLVYYKLKYYFLNRRSFNTFKKK